ncbi:MAG: hypothetical protein V1858_04385 [Candidatus Gottesmanbacteria bacterium]
MRVYLDLQKKHGDPRQFWPGWCARKKSLKLREEIAIGAILTQRTNWRNVDMALTYLRSQGMLSINGIYSFPENRDCRSRIFSPHVVRGKLESTAPARSLDTRIGKGISVGMLKIVTQHSLNTFQTLEELIRPAGFYHQKAKKLWGFCRMVIEEYGSLKKFMKEDLATARSKLLNLWGIGPETADSILLYALDKPSFVIDEYTRRLLTKNKLVRNFDYDFLKNLFENNLPQNFRLFQDFHCLIVVEEKGTENSRMEK